MVEIIITWLHKHLKTKQKFEMSFEPKEIVKYTCKICIYFLITNYLVIFIYIRIVYSTV